jgi:ubiquitin carboxyl-terminal hydrolase 3
MCLKCGSIHCSRYINKHAIDHSEMSGHQLAISINLTSAFCYACNDFIDYFDELNAIRQEMTPSTDPATSDSETSITLEETSTKSLSDHPLLHHNNHHHQQEPEATSSSTSSYDSGLDSLSSGINLRPRKRTNTDEDTDAPKNAKKKATGKGSQRKGVGLKNLGNTCFMNSVLQSLSNIQPFTHYFSNLPKIEQPKPRLCTRSVKENLEEIFLVEELRKVLIDLTSDNKPSISPECLFLVIWKVVPQFKGYHQHDAHEFLRYMLDRLHTELQSVPNSMPAAPTNSKMKNFVCPTPSKKGSSFVTTTFGGTLLSEVKCLVCGQMSRKHDPFLDLSLDIPEKYYKDSNADDAEPITNCDIADCLNSFVAVEELTETELYYCSNCKKKQRSTKRFWIRRLPNVLCLHIKRFRWNSYYR